MRRTNAWNRLMESTEGPNVTVQIPREWAEELLRALATALEVEDMGDDDGLGDGEMGGMEVPHMEPDEDDLGGPSDGDFDFGGGDDADLMRAGDSDEDEDEPEEEDDEEEDDEDEKDEAVDFAGSDRPTRPGTALGESSFARLAKKIGPSPRRRRR